MAKAAVRQAAQRAEQRAPIRRHSRSAADRYHINRSSIPDGMTYEWKRATYMGKEDVDHQIDLAENGWTAVPANRHPELAGRKVESDAMIVRGGLVLMERPTDVTFDARQEDKARAKEQLTTQIHRLGLTERGTLPRARPQVRRTYEAAEIPGDGADEG
jgi:hypothetical protein